MTGKIKDNTDRKRVEQELTEANERLRLAMEAGSAGGWEFDLRTGRNLWFGKAHLQLGMTPDETSGSRMEFWNRVHEEDRERVKHALEVARETREDFTEDFRVVWRDGTTHWLRSRGRFHYTADGEAERLLGISLEITERKQAEQTLRESEQRLRLATQIGRMYAYEWDLIADVVTRSSEHVQILGLTEPLRDPQHQFVDKIHPGDRQKFLDAIAGLNPENPTAEVTYRAVASDGTLVWLKSNGRGFFDEQGKLLRVIGMVADVTELKRAEESLAELTRRLIESQEQERARIGRELHDDICQRVALLGIRLGQLKDSPGSPSDEIPNQLSKMEKEAVELSMRIQQLSRELHSSTLEFLGLNEAIRSWCDEFSEKWSFEILFENHDVPTSLPSEISLNLFRVFQEALNNAAKYSGVERFDVRLWGTPAEVHLSVTDHGKGFDISSAMMGRGIGLKSMRERVKLMNGHLTIESKPNCGTTIHVRVPVDPGDQPSLGSKLVGSQI
jgi:PAS domain S-box-containing protein